MASGPGHYREAERCITQGCASDERGEAADATVWLALAQVHATLALAAATVALITPEIPILPSQLDAWTEVTS